MMMICIKTQTPPRQNGGTIIILITYDHHAATDTQAGILPTGTRSIILFLDIQIYRIIPGL